MRVLCCFSVLAIVGAADLPVTGVTVLPGGLIVEREGTVPAGDESLTGLPPGLDEGSLSVAVEGREVEGWRLLRPAATPRREDPAAQQAIDAAEDGVRAAELRRSLAAAAEAASAEDRGSPPALPGAAAIRARVAFAEGNAARAAREALAAEEASDTARAVVAASPPACAPPPELRVPGIGGRQVRLRYLVPGSDWAPAWRLEVEGGTATLVQLALVDLRGCPALPPAPLTVATRGRADAALLPDPQVPLLGLRESLELERLPPETVSACAVEASVRRFGSALRDPAAPVPDCLMQLLVALGSGYDHKTPTKYRNIVSQAIARIGGLDPARLELALLALAVADLGEAYAMTGDAALRPTAETFLACLRRRWRSELGGLVGGNGPLAGPQAASLVCLALKSSLAAGLDVGTDPADLRQLPLGGGEEAELAAAMIAIFTGQRDHPHDADVARRWVDSFDRWWASGRIELIHLAVLVAFQYGGESWKLVEGMRARLVALQQQDGMWPLEHHPLGRVYASGYAALCLETYYRYSPVRPPVSLHAAAATVLDAPPSWPIRQAAASAVALAPGRQTVELRRVRLDGAIAWEAVPALSPGVWRRLHAPNPWRAPLPAGRIEVVVDGRHQGVAVLGAVAPDAALVVDLGADDRLRVRRTLRSGSDDGVFKRTLTVQVACRLEAPPGWSEPVLVREPLPHPPPQIEVELLAPERLAGAAYAKRLAEDAQLTATLTAAAPEAQLAQLRLTYPRAVRPRLQETR